MKNQISIILFILFISITNSYSQKTIKISNGEWPPFFSKDLKYNGVSSHIVQKAFELQNIQVDYKWYPWNRSLQLAKIGEVDATVGWSKTKNREKDFYFSDPIIEGSVVFFHLKNHNFKWESIDKLENLKIGTINGYEYGNKISKLMQKENIKIYNVINEEKLFEMLLKKRFDIAIINLDAGFGIINKYFSKKANDITYNKKPFHKEYLRVLFSKKVDKNYELTNEFNKNLNLLKQKGIFNKMYEDSRKGLYIK